SISAIPTAIWSKSPTWPKRAGIKTGPDRSGPVVVRRSQSALARGDRLGARQAAVEPGGEIGPARQVDLAGLGPADHGGDVEIGDRKVLAQQVVAAGKVLVEHVERLLQRL